MAVLDFIKKAVPFGAAAGFVKNKDLFGGRDKKKELSNLSPEQEELMQLITQGITQGSGPLGELFGNFNQENFDKGVSQPALKHFQDKILPVIQEKFAGQGVNNSGLQRATANAGADLQSQLANLLYNARSDQKNNQVKGIAAALGTQTKTPYIAQGKTGIIPGLFQGGAGNLSQIAQKAIMG